LTSNITIATFAEFGLYKKEAYDANLWAGKILAEHGVPVAYKSVSSAHIKNNFLMLIKCQDHVDSETNAKYLL
jgi:hypothetical protein